MRVFVRICQPIFLRYKKAPNAGNMPHMSNNISDRIRQRLEVTGKSARGASLEVGKSPDLLRGILSGRNKSLNADTARRLAHVLGVSVEWLITGEGETNDAPSDSQQLPRLSVPLISWVSAGRMSFPDITDDIIGYVQESDLDPNGDWIALRVVGDSMDRISPPESIIFVDRADKVLVPNACYVISNDDGEATYKRFRSNPMRFEPVSTNPTHEPIYPRQEPLIVGRVKRSVLTM